MGIDPSIYVQVLTDSNMGTRMLAGKAGQMVAGDYAARFSVANLRKDVHLALGLARHAGLHLVQGESASERPDKAASTGLGDLDIAALRTLLA